MRKPRHLTPENARRFAQKSIVDRYHLRIPYPKQTFDILSELCIDTPRIVLDVGTGTGEIARYLSFASRVDAVDSSLEMINRGRILENGNLKRVNWLHGRIEEMELVPPYSLIMGADSMQWLDWSESFPKFSRLLSPNGSLVLISRNEINIPWQDKLAKLISRFSLMQDYDPYDLVDELISRNLFVVTGTKTTDPVMSSQSVDDYVQSFHSRTSLSLDDMPPRYAKEFDRLLREIVTPHAQDGILTLFTQVRLIWGRPLS